MPIGEDREKALESAMTQVERQFGKGAIMKLGSKPVMEVPVISTSALSLDKALGIGGLPRGRVVEIFGPEASGKTTLALHAVAEAQKNDGIAAFIDAEHAIDIGYAKRLGVNASSRASFYFYNTLDEVDQLASALQETKRVFRRA